MRKTQVLPIATLALALASAATVRAGTTPEAPPPVTETAAAIQAALPAPAGDLPRAGAATAVESPRPAEPIVKPARRPSKSRKFAQRMFGVLAVAGFAATYVVEP